MEHDKQKYFKLLQEDSMNKYAWNNLGILYSEEDMLDEAQNCFQSAIEIDGNYAGALYNLSFIYLLQGNLEQGLELFEYRCKTSKKRYNFSTRGELPSNKRLHRLEKLEGKTLFIYLEKDFVGGFGDAIMLSRYIPLLKKYNCKIIMDVDKSLVDLLKGSSLGVDKFNPFFLKYDYHIPLFSLPYLFTKDFNSIPFNNGYLKPDVNKVLRYKKEYFDTDKLKVGICYQGNLSYFPERSINPLFLEDLFECDNVQFYSFQKNSPYNHYRLTNLGDSFKDFSDTAAAACNLDLMISIDTSIAHLCGALNIPTWLLLPKRPEWRWFLNRNNSPWYSSMKLYRQKYKDKWSPVILDVQNDLETISRKVR